MDKERMEQCGNCQNGLNTHCEGDIHEVCEAGICVLCFQSGRCGCDDFKPIKSE